MLKVTPEERKHLAQHLLGCSYPKKDDAELTVSLLTRLGYSAKLVETTFEGTNEVEWSAECKELEG